MHAAACAGLGTALFFSPDPGTPGSRPGGIAQVRRICAACPVQVQCRDYAIRTNSSGYWAGTTERERRQWMR
jgi:WhiB family redox-sensing transcriptional regulator